MMPGVVRRIVCAANRQLGAALVLVVFGATGCLHVTTHPATARPIRLASPSGFVLLQRTSRAGELAPLCTVTTVDANVRAVRGDTLELTTLRRVRTSADTPERPDRDAYLLVLSQHPEVQSETGKRDIGGIILSIVMLPVATVVLILASVL